MTIIALDIGTTLGYYIEGSDRAYSINLGKGDDRFSEFFTVLEDMIETLERPIHIVHEDASRQKGNGVPVYHGLIGVLKAFCTKNDITISNIHSMTVKKIFTGKGRWMEEDCIRLAEENKIKVKKAQLKKLPIMLECDKIGIGYTDDNGADAYAVYFSYKELSK